MKLTKGKCQNCGFRGLLRPKAMVRPADLNAITGETSDAVPTLDVCVTCYHTPAGVISANASHQRLPKSEYR